MLDFSAYAFSSVLTEMDSNFVGGLADFLYQHEGALRYSGWGGVCNLFIVQSSLLMAFLSPDELPYPAKIRRIYGSHCLLPPVCCLWRFPPRSFSRQRESECTVSGRIMDIRLSRSGEFFSSPSFRLLVMIMGLRLPMTKSICSICDCSSFRT